MANLNEILQDMVNKEYDELLGIAKLTLKDILPACKAVDKDNDGVLMLSAILLSAVGADGTLSVKERQFLRDLLNFSDEQVSNLIKLYNADMANLVDTFVDTLEGDVKTSTVLLVASICAIDETISADEISYIKKLLA